MRRRILDLLLPIAAISVAWAVARVDAVRRVVLPAPPTAEAQLEQPVGELRIDGANFEQVLDVLRQRTGAKITVDREAIATIAGSPADVLARPLELHLLDMTLGQVLGRLCAAADPERLTYVEDGDGIVVTTRGGLDRYTCVRVYDIRDMLPPAGHAEPAEKMAMATACSAHQQQQLAGELNLAVEPGRMTMYEVIEAITDMIATGRMGGQRRRCRCRSARSAGGSSFARRRRTSGRLRRLLDGLRRG